MESKVWLLMGLTGSLEGVLSQAGSTISFSVSKKGSYMTDSQLEELGRNSGKHNLMTDLEDNKEVDVISVSISRIDKIQFP